MGSRSCVLFENFKCELIVYQMGRLCGGAHEISGIKAQIFLRGWVGVVGWVGGDGGGRVGDDGVGWVVVGVQSGGGLVGGVIRLSF